MIFPRARGSATEQGTVGVLVLRSYLLAGNCAHYDGVIQALETRGLRVIPAFAAGLDARPAIEKFFVKDGAVQIDALVSLTGFSLVGGPAYNDSKAAEETLARARCALYRGSSGRISDPRAMGCLGARLVAGRVHHHGCHSRTRWRHRAAGLRRPLECERQGYGGASRARHDVGRAHREVDRSAPREARGEEDRHRAFQFSAECGQYRHGGVPVGLRIALQDLSALRREGYKVDLPESVDALREKIISGNAAKFGAVANVHERIPASDHVRRERHLKEIEAQWGPAPGKQQSDGGSIFVLGERFGNIFVGIQPPFGIEGDPMRLLFEKGFAPTHAFSAFYRFLREDFGAHALLHFGTHGALEFMPGKQSGMSGNCWPDRLIDDMPNLYLYASNNPSEGTIAKRRTGATLISYLTPPLTDAGLYRGFIDLKESIDGWRALSPGAGHADSLAELIQSQAAELNLAQLSRAGVWMRPTNRGAPADDPGAGAHPDSLWPACRGASGIAGAARRSADGHGGLRGRRLRQPQPSRAAVQALVEGKGVEASLAIAEPDREHARSASRLGAIQSTTVREPGARGHSAGAGWRVPAPRAGRRSHSHARCAAHRTQSARLRSVSHPEHVRGPRRRAPSHATHRAAHGARQSLSRIDRARAVGNRQPEDRRRPHRASVGAVGRAPAFRCLRPHRRRDADPARRSSAARAST